MMRLPKTLLIAAAVASLLWPAAAVAQESGAAGGARATRMAAHAPRHVAKPKPRQARKQNRSRYGFLPGYRQPPNLSDWRDRRPGYPGYQARNDRYEMRYWTWDGRLLYGWGGAGFYRGRWNGGSMGPCWTSTPIGFMWNCGR